MHCTIHQLGLVGVLIRVYHLIKSITSVVQAHISSYILIIYPLTSHTCMYNYYSTLHHTTVGVGSDPTMSSNNK